MSLIDTNLLIYATVPGFSEHDAARAFLEDIVNGSRQHFVTWINIFEYLRAVTHRRLVRPAPLPMADALHNVEALLALPRVSRIDPGPKHLELFTAICRAAGPVEGNFVHDCRIAAVMRENGVDRIVTRDSSFRRIAFLEVIDPFA
jgi:toxin-antitoxin system PIN domain toxin